MARNDEGKRPAPEALVMQMILGKWVSRPIAAAVELGIPEALASGPRSVRELAEETGTHLPSLCRLLRALSALGLVAEERGRGEQGVTQGYALTPLGACLSGERLGSVARLFHADWHDTAWARLADSVRTGESAFSLAHGCPSGAWLAERPGVVETVNDAQAAKIRTRTASILETLPLDGVAHVADVGGGDGTLLVALLTAHPELRGTVLDFEPAIVRARRRIADARLGERCRAVVADFRGPLPVTADACVLSDILHNQGDDACVQLLRRCRAALRGPRLVFALEFVLTADGGPVPAALLDLEMLVMSEGGRERTEEEYRALFTGAGFELERVVPTAAGVSVLCARASAG